MRNAGALGSRRFRGPNLKLAIHGDRIAVYDFSAGSVRPAPGKGQSYRFPWDRAPPAAGARTTQSAGTPGDVMPVAGENQHQDHRPDDQNSGSFKPVDVGLGRSAPGKADPAVGWRRARDYCSPGLVWRGRPRPRERERNGGLVLSNRSKAVARRAFEFKVKSRGRGARATHPNAKLPAAVSTPPRSSPQKIIRFAVFEVDLAAGELRKNGARIRSSGAALSDTGLPDRPRRRSGHARGTPPEIMARRHLRRFRPQPEYRDQQTARGPGRLGLEPALCRNPGAARISLPGSPANGGESTGSTARTGRNCGPGGLPS